MKFNIFQSHLIESLNNVASVIPSRSTATVLENILFELNDNNLKITGTDLEVYITTEVVPDKIEKQGSVAIPAKVLLEMIRSLPDIPIQFEIGDSNRVNITTDRGYYQITGISKENFPELPVFTEEKTIELKNIVLKRMFEKTIFAVSSEELRPALMGVFMQVMADELRMVATDGHRLSKIVDRSFSFDDAPKKMIIPPKAVQIAIKNLDEKGSTKITIDEHVICFNFDSTKLYTRLVEGEYPDYEKVIPRDNDKTLKVNKDLLMDSVKRVSLFSSSLTNQVRFSLSSDKLVIFSENTDTGGQAREELEAEYSDEEMEIGYNAQYIMDILRHIDSDDVTFNLKSPVRAAIVTPTTQLENEEFFMLIMPIKISS